MSATQKPKIVPHSAQVTLVGEIVEQAAVISQVATEWPKVGCRVMVKHSPDQATVFAVVSIGPVAEAMWRKKVGQTVKVVGQIKAATGPLEVFATSFEKAVATAVPAGYRTSLMSDFLGLPPTPPPEADDED